MRRALGQLLKLKLLQSFRLPVKGKRSCTSRPLAERRKGVRERSNSCLESDHCSENFLFILNAKDIRLQNTPDSRSDFTIRQAVDAIERPDGFDHGDKTDNARAIFCQVALDNLRSFDA